MQTLLVYTALHEAFRCFHEALYHRSFFSLLQLVYIFCFDDCISLVNYITKCIVINYFISGYQMEHARLWFEIKQL